MHAVVPARPEIGLKEGVIFTLRNVNDSVNEDKQNRLHPFYLVYIARDGEVIANHFEVKKLLDLVRTSASRATLGSTVLEVVQLAHAQVTVP